LRSLLDTEDKDGGEPNKDLRTLEGKKTNYSVNGAKIDVEWKDGLFQRVAGPTGFAKMAADQKTEEIYLTSLKRRRSQARTVSDKPGANYAPAIFAKEPEAIAAGLTKKQLETAMERLFADGKIRVDVNGPPSRAVRSIVIVEDYRASEGA
jgi:hypothetical protein